MPQHDIAIPRDRPVTVEDLPDFVEPEEVEGMSSEQLLAFLERLKRQDEEGMLDSEGNVLLY